MNNLFKNKYKIDSARLQSWDYSWDGIYFITICTANMHHYFGKINSNNSMDFSDSGKIANQIWELIPTQFPFVELGEFIIIIVLVDNFLTGNSNNLPVHENCKFIKCDVNNYKEISPIMCSFQFDYVFHYAAVVGVKRTLDNPKMVLDDIQGIKNV